MHVSTSKQLIINTKSFLEIAYYSFIDRSLSKKGIFYGWGRKKSGLKAIELSIKHDTSFVLLEDGFIRSVGLGVDGVSSFSLVKDDVGIYYDATTASRLENILNTYDFSSDITLMHESNNAIALIKKHNISKYNHTSSLSDDFKKKYKLTEDNLENKKILIVAQTFADMSLKYGLSEKFSTDNMIQAAIDENPGARIYLKIHPDVLSGKKKSDIDIEKAKQNCIVIDDNVNPISLLRYFSKIYTKTSQMGFEALLLGKECVCFGMPFYAGWGVTDDRVLCKRRQKTLSVEEIFAGAYILYTQYVNPYNNTSSDIISTIYEIINIKKSYIEEKNHTGYFFGFSRWKHRLVKPFFSELKDNNMIFINPIFNKKYLDCARKQGLNKKSHIYIWGKKEFKEVEEYAKEHNIKLFHVEDGFIRSVGLGSDLTQPYSQVVDSRGIYFDPTQESDLEYILNHYDFSKDIYLLDRARKVRQYLLAKKLSKYNLFDAKELSFPKEKKIILVPGQVEDDASIKLGTDGLDNITLLISVRKKSPNAHIIYKPHPDVLVGNRVGYIEESIALQYCDEIITEVSLDSVLMGVDEVHTMTSLVGFEALIRGKDVYTYGMPFYAGWGLSNDEQISTRRIRNLSIDELLAAVLILYPKYIDPRNKKPCTIEVFLEGLDEEKEKYLNLKYVRIWVHTRNFMSRKIQVAISFIKSTLTAA